MDRTASLSVIVPTYNEQYLIESSLARLCMLTESPLLERIRVIVVDDGSTDQTPAAIERFRSQYAASPSDGRLEWMFLRQEQNAGKGAAIRKALEYVDTELAVIHDADLEYHPQDLLPMIPLFLQEGADAVYGSRFLSGGYRRVLLFRHALGNRFLTLMTDLVSDLNLTDVETCYKMVRAELLKSIPIRSRDFRFEVEITLKLAKRGARIFELPISYSGRTYAEGKKINWKDGIRAFGALIRYSLSDEIYAADPYGSQILARMSRAPRFNRWMADTVRPYVGEHVLEIGAGTGNITLNLAPRREYWATDVNPLYLRQLRQLRQTRPYLQVREIDAELPESFPAGESLDTVVCLNVVEHLDNDETALRNIFKALQAGGRAIILVPQGPKLFGSLDQVLGHRRRYTREQLIQVGRQSGFELEALIPFNRIGSLAWWLNGRVLRRHTFGLMQIKLLNFLTPLFRLLDPWTPLPPLSLVAVFRKAATASETPGLRPESPLATLAHRA